MSEIEKATLDSHDGLNSHFENAVSELNSVRDNALGELENATSGFHSELDDHYNGISSELDSILANSREEIEKAKSDAIDEIESTGDIFSNALKGAASGEAIVITDVSPIEHKMNVKVRGKNLLNPQLLNLKKNGGVMQIANSPSYDYDNDTATITMNEEGTNDNNGVYGAPLTLEVEKTYCISFDIRGADGKKVQCGFSGKKRAITLTPEYVRYSYDYTFAEGSSQNIIFYSRSTANGGLAVGETMQFRNVQIEEGTTATDYSPYVEDISAVKVTVSDGDAVSKQYDVNEDGTVDDVTSIYPNMTLSTDTAGAVIDCAYNRDINKAFAELQSIVNTLVGG